MKKLLLNCITVSIFLGLAALSSNAQSSVDATAPAAVAPTAGQNISGTVLETMNASGYTYLQVDTGLSKPWIAIPQSQVKVGEKVSCQSGMVMKDFTSKALNRTFDAIVFSGGLIGAAAANPHAGMGGMGMGMGGGDSFASAVKAEGGGSTMGQQPSAASSGSKGAIAPFAEISVEKTTAANGYTVDEIFSQSTELNGKTVAIKGKVVKFSPMIMGVNWVHLQDGTGDPEKNTHDLVVTTSEIVNKGDVITMEGVLAANKNFGAGYKYDAIVEKAKTLK